MSAWSSDAIDDHRRGGQRRGGKFGLPTWEIWLPTREFEVSEGVEDHLVIQVISGVEL